VTTSSASGGRSFTFLYVICGREPHFLGSVGPVSGISIRASSLELLKVVNAPHTAATHLMVSDQSWTPHRYDSLRADGLWHGDVPSAHAPHLHHDNTLQNVRFLHFYLLPAKTLRLELLQLALLPPELGLLLLPRYALLSLPS
jgi:hypothetical protein